MRSYRAMIDSIPSTYNQNIAVHLIASIFMTSTVATIIYYVFKPALHHRSSDSQITVSEVIIARKETKHDVTTDENSEFLLSLVIPAYNEEDRLPLMLEHTINYLIESQNAICQLCYQALGIDQGDLSNNNGTNLGRHLFNPPFQILIVDDGSSDGTQQSVKRFLSEEYSRRKDMQEIITIKVLALEHNSGKGAAVKVGMLRCKSKLALMLDADGATEISSLQKLLGEMKHRDSEAKVVFGSRAHLEEKSKAERSVVRTILMNAFHFFVKILIGGHIKDTQCGFKLFHGDVVKIMFGNLHLRRWAFDTELIVIAERFDIKISEVGVEWQEIDGSKLNTGRVALLFASAGMLRDMICVRLCYALNFWKLKNSEASLMRCAQT